VADCCLWSIERYSRRYEGAVRNVRAVVHGHMTMHEPGILGNVYFIDTGGWRPGGRLSFLNLETLQVTDGPIHPRPSWRNR
ncbi:MAG: hypothetical protein ABI357_04915, partial [Granulicella sp.]